MEKYINRQISTSEGHARVRVTSDAPLSEPPVSLDKRANYRQSRSCHPHCRIETDIPTRSNHHRPNHGFGECDDSVAPSEPTQVFLPPDSNPPAHWVSNSDHLRFLKQSKLAREAAP